MDNYVMAVRSQKLEEMSKQLGFARTIFKEDVEIVKGETKKELLKKINRAKNKLTIYKPSSEEMLRFALEKTKIDVVYGMEDINPKDSMHYVRAGLDQVSCKIAAKQGKIIGFFFSEILNSKNRPKLLARMRLNTKLCKKYKVKMVFSNFAFYNSEMRSAKDLQAFWRVLEKEKLW